MGETIMQDSGPWFTDEAIAAIQAAVDAHRPTMLINHHSQSGGWVHIRATFEGSPATAMAFAKGLWPHGEVELCGDTVYIHLPREQGPEGFEPDEWEKQEGSPYLHKGRRKTYGELMAHVMAGLGGVEALEREPGFEYCSWEIGTGSLKTLGPDAALPPYRWGIAWPVTGGSEGHYVHVELFCGEEQPGYGGKRVALALLKTFGGWDAAVDLASRIARLLGA
jgi:hypothetical protein